MIFATGPGQAALDGPTGTVRPFTRALIDGAEIRKTAAPFDRLGPPHEIAHMLSEPIEKIEYFDGGEVRFSGGKCFVAVTIRAKPLSPKELRSAAGPDLVGNVGSLQRSGG
jgi:hypothetical protein